MNINQFLKQREKLPEELRGLFGEITNPSQLVATTVNRLTSYVENFNFYQKLLEADNVPGQKLFATSPTREFNTEVPLQDSPIDGLFTTKELDATYLASMTLLVATFLVFPFTFLESGLHFNHSNEVLLSVFLLGFLCTGLAYMGYVILIKRVGPVKASTVVLIVPVSGMLWANLFLDEAITYTMLVGCLLIITGVGLINFFKDDLN